MYMNTGKLLVNVNLIAGLALATLFTSGLAAQTAQPAEKTTANMVVTEQTRQGSGTSPITARDVTVSQGHERDQVTRWVPAQGADGGLELYILMDDDSASMVNTQLGDIRNFIMEQPVPVKIGVAYMRNGIARVAQEATSDHSLAAKALRLPIGLGGVNGSPYFALSNLVKHWPQSQDRREVLMISDGVDRYYESNDMFDPYLAKAIDDAQRAGVVVSTIYTPGVGTFYRSGWGTYWGQIYLSHVAKETGGQAYYIGFNRPAVAFAPFLDDLANRLNHQYLLSFQAEPEKRPGLEPVKVTAAESNRELVAAESVFVPGNR
jgi:hypothetical protein